MRLIALALLTLVSMGAAAQTKIKVQIANDGKFDGGTIKVFDQEEQKDGGVKVTITVSPNSGYTIKKEAIKVYATYPPSGSRADTRDIEIASSLTLLYNGSEKEDVKDASAKRDYTFIVPSGFGAWVKEAKFQLDGSKGGSEPTRTIDPDNLSGVYYIGTVTHSTESTTNNFYLCPTEGYYYYQSTSPYYTNVDNGMPFLTTYKCRSTAGYDERKALWVIEKHPSLDDCYYIKHAIDGKYLTYNAGFLTNKGRVRFHLEESPSNNDYALFFINYYDNTSSYEIISKYASDNNIDPDGGKPRKYLNINKGNQQSLEGTNADKTQAILTGGIIGLWTAGNSESSGSGKFYLESAVSIDPPTITNKFDGTITIEAATGATIYYTTDGSTPTMSSPVYSTAITLTEDITVIKAIAKAESDYYPTVATTYNLPSCERPSISVSGGNVTITCTTEGATIHYTTDGSHATSSSTVYTGPFAKGSATEIRAIATKVGYVNSNEAALLPPTEVSFSSEITDMNGNYSLASNFSSDVSIGTSENPFSGTIDGNYITFSLSQAFIDVADGAIIKNIIISSANISGSGNAGAIVNTAKGSTRIYNCGVLDGSISGDDNVGGIAGELQGLSRVINCYNYANIESGNNCGGIVGYNRVASTSSNLQTMVMNCMFYGNITGGNAAPIYGGEIIHNKYSNANNTGLNNYCYFLYDEEKVPYVKTIADDKYHGALGAEERYLNRFEFFRMTLNSTRDMAAFYVTGDATQKDEMAKWVLDKSIAPYPILKTQGKYPSVVNPDAAHATAQTDRNKGGLLGTLSVTISGVGGGAQFTAPSGASITTNNLTLNITDKDYDNFNYNYKKVQLPYYSEVGTGNYTSGRVVTGWKITSITGGTPGSFTTDTYDYPSFNFVDRECTNKDLYSVSKRVFSQGAYFEVPDGVESITIEPYWAKAVYLSDANYDVTYNGTSKYGVTVGGSCPSTYNGQQVYNSVSSAMTNLGSNASHSVYDYAVVLVGNYHQYADGALVNDTKPVTFMSADLDGDDEPDNTLFYYHNQRKRVSPIRFDFLNIPGVGMVKRTYDATMDPEPGIFKPRGWFEITNTVFIRFGQFEYAGGNNGDTKDIMAPLILQGGIYEQFVSCCRADAHNTNYLLIGSNAWFKNFANGCHTAQANKTPKVPINVAGGDYTNFYLTGIYQPNANEDAANAECYIDGGRFTEVAGAGMQQIKGDVTWLINAADITSFFGGGINATKPITGSISTTISNSNVDKFYGGPKFGDMYEEKTVTTNATDCHFGKFFGAGYGGTAFNRVGCEDDSKADNSRGWDSWVTKYYKRAYDGGNGGISTNYDYEFILHSDGKQTVARFFVNYASLSLASTRNVTNTLSGCTIGTFYGGGSLGAVNGDVNSTLTNCTVTGSAFGAGFSASVPTVEVWNNGAFLTPRPTYNRKANVFNNANVKTPKDNNQFVVYTWSNTYGTNTNPFTDEDGKHYIHTDVSLDGLGSVTGKATLTINGTTTVGESVYGGGEESGVGDGTEGDGTELNITSGTIGTEGQGGVEYGNVYGGGKGKVGDKVAGYVKGNTAVNISQDENKTTTIYHNVYGGGAYGSVGDFTYDASTGMPTACAENTGSCTVNIQSGTFGWDGDENGMVFGSSRGDVATPEGTPAVDPNDRMAWVYSTQVNIGTENATTGPHIKGSVYGSGENGHTFQNTELNIYSGTIGIPTGSPITDNNGTPEDTSDDKSYSGASYPYRGNVYGGGCGTDKYDSDGDKKEDSYNPLAGIVRGTTTINIKGGHVVRNVYGAGAMGSVGGGTTDEAGKTTINVKGGRIGYDGNCDNDGCIFGAARGEYGVSTAASGLANVRETEVNISYATTPTKDKDDKTEQLIAGSVFGGGEAGTVKESVAVNMTGGLILKDLYGGGALADTQTSNWNPTGGTNGKGAWAEGKTSASSTTTVRATGGIVKEEIYGGALGEAGKPAYVWGDVLLDLNGTTPIDETTHKPSTTGSATANATGCVVGQVFGCNNVNGTPKGDVMVHVYATQNAVATQIANTEGETPVTDAKEKGRYDVTAVYGGGNQAAYDPVSPYTTSNTSGAKTQVIIEGCSLTSIETVYGGGNAAAVPETNVEVRSAYEIGYLFGGGNGKDDIAPGVENLGADVGTLDHGTTTYGTGNANTLMEGGLIHEAYGGSNQKGIIKGSINQITNPGDPEDPDCCELAVEKIVGAGKYADIDGDVNMTLSCQPNKKVNQLFAGADEANVNGNITLNITNGHFGDVFGGNNLGGAVKGKITVNVEETECQPIKIDNLYLGGNKAAYSIFGYYESDEIHKETGKKILKPRESANDSHTPVDNPATDATHTFPYAQPELNIISCTYIGNVFGGGLGKEAKMYANPTVNVNMVAGAHAATAVPAMMEELHLDVTKTAANPDKLGIIRNVYGGGDAADIDGNTTVNIGTAEKVYLTSEPTYLGEGNYKEITANGDPHKGMFEVAAKGAYIIGSVFGGGNAADVLGNTNVTVSGGYVFNGIFGGGYAGSVGTFTRSTAEADVNIYGHTTHTGCIGKPISCAEGTGKCTVLVNGGQIGPLSVATEGMNRSKADGGPVPEGWVWGAGQGLVEDPAEHPDTHFTSYVGSTDVTIGGTALIMESIIGGGEFGRVLGNTLVKIEGGQIGIGAGKVDGDNNPIRYTDDQFVNPLTTTVTDANALAECSHYPYGRDTNSDGKPDEFLPYDPYYEDYPTYVAAHTDLGPASTLNPSDGKTWIGCVFGGGSGYMPYKFKDNSGYDWVRSAGWVEGNSEVRISGGHILTNVYGGNEVTDVKGKSIVKMTGGTIGVPRTLKQIAEHPLSCYLFGAGKGDDRSHFYNYTNVGSVEVEVSGGIIYGSVFGGSEDGHVTGDIKVDIKPGAIIGTWGTSYVDGNVFGAGRGFSGNTLTGGNVGGNVTLNISGGNILGSVYGGGRLASVGTYLVPSTDDNYGKMIPDNGDDKHGHITINISGGTIGNNIEYINNPSAEQKAAMPNTTFDYQNHLQYTKGGNVFTAGMGRLYALDNTTALSSWQKLGQCKQTVLNMTGGTVKISVYGGGEIGIVAQSATVNIDGGTVGTKVVDPEDATKYYFFGSVFGGGKGSVDNITYPSTTPEAEQIPISEAGTTQGDVEVHLNKTVASDDSKKGAIVHQVFGCNDMNGSPKGDVTVHVYATQNADKDNISTKPTKGTETFDVEAIYGGGNLAAYEPEGGKNTTKSTKVIIDGCGLTSVRQVYGGGNAASTPATNVEVNGTYEILELFGGGNGLDNLPDGRPNPGANVGYKNYTIYEKDGDNWVAKDDPAYDTKEERIAGGSTITYGTGQASLNVFGGTVHRVFGGSNTKGNVRQSAVTLLDENGGCTFCVDEAYGGGKSAPMDAEAKLLMACIPGLQAAYGGAEAAAIKGNVTLNITNGTFDRVFGGNNLSGTIDGSITVNIQEVGCRPIIIGELYGGGNQAAYSVYGYDADGKAQESGTQLYDDPQVNVMSFTSIGKVFGGGYGEPAVMVGNPTVNVNEVYGRYYDDDRSVVDEGAETPNHYPIPPHAKGKMGAISEVFGGGNAAPVKGNTTVNIATQAEVYNVKQVTVGDAVTDLYTRSGEGTELSPYVYTPAVGIAQENVTYYEKKDVLGVDIRGNVYGGGNKADVTGSTNVVVGKKSN